MLHRPLPPLAEGWNGGLPLKLWAPVPASTVIPANAGIQGRPPQPSPHGVPPFTLGLSKPVLRAHEGGAAPYEDACASVLLTIQLIPNLSEQAPK